MKIYEKIKYLATTILIISLIFGQFSLLTIEATEEYQNSTRSYNCYAYAINKIIFDETFYYPYSIKPRYQPGDIGEDNINNFDSGSGYELNRIKCNVIQDLYAMGHTGVMVYNNINDVASYNTMLTNICFSTQELICFRVGPSDYHFMRYDYATNSWYNKNGYDPIYKYTDNGGIPSNNVHWVSGSNVYDSEIIYIVYDKLRIDLSEDGEWEGNITVKGSPVIEDIYSYNNFIYCCSNEACCNPDGVCECESTVINGGKDVVYEIVVPESGCYNISLSGGISSGFNYKIYSYNMYNGDYRILSEDITTIDVNVNLYFTAGENVVDRYYLRVDYRKENTFDVSINVSASRQHTYTHSYESISNTEHKAFCQCGEYEIQTHAIVGSVCRLCDGVHTHEYNDHCEESTSSQHKVYCWCGAYQLQDHLYTDQYEVISSVFHKAYCACGAFEFEEHVMVDGECELCGEVHVHEYTEYEYYSNTQHIEKCACGAVGTYLSAHTVRSGIGRFKECIECGGVVDTFSGPNQLESTINMVTANGSYILPNGVIVLVDEDIEAYLNGTLVFYNRGDNSEAA